MPTSFFSKLLNYFSTKSPHTLLLCTSLQNLSLTADYLFIIDQLVGCFVGIVLPSRGDFAVGRGSGEYHDGQLCKQVSRAHSVLRKGLN